MSEERKVVQFSIVRETFSWHRVLTAVCDDGTAWMRYMSVSFWGKITVGKWTQVSPPNREAKP